MYPPEPTNLLIIKKLEGKKRIFYLWLEMLLKGDGGKISVAEIGIIEVLWILKFLFSLFNF